MKLHRTASAILGALALAAGATPAMATWNDTQWGMTVAEVLATVGVSARQVRDERDKRILDQRRLVTSEDNRSELHYTVDYFFDPDDRTLSKVMLVPETAECPIARQAFAATLGPGQTEEKRIEIAPGRPGIIELSQAWPDPAGQGTVTYLSISFETDIQHCQILFEE